MAEQASADTSVQQDTQKTPEAGTDTSAQTTQGDTGKPEVVTLTKEQHDDLQRQIASGKSAQRDIARYQRVFGKLDGKAGHFAPAAAKPAAETTTPSQEELEAAGAEEDRKAEKLLLGLAVDPTYRDVLDADPTLRSLLTTDPLAVLSLLAPEALDAQDALDLVKEKLDERKSKLAPAKAKEVEDKKADEVKAPKPGVVNNGTENQDAEYEAARKIPNTESALANMIKIGIRKMPGNKK